VRRPACAVAYLDSECELYVEFKGRHPSFSEETAAKLSKINVRDGCTLSIYDEVEYEGEITLIDSDTQAIEEVCCIGTEIILGDVLSSYIQLISVHRDGESVLNLTNVTVLLMSFN
jgi:hypothetical protein